MFIIKKGVVVLDYIYICVHVKVKYFQKNQVKSFSPFSDDFFYNGSFCPFLSQLIRNIQNSKNLTFSKWQYVGTMIFQFPYTILLLKQWNNTNSKSKNVDLILVKCCFRQTKKQSKFNIFSRHLTICKVLILPISRSFIIFNVIRHTTPYF